MSRSVAVDLIDSILRDLGHFSSKSKSLNRTLTQKQIDEFIKNGVLVVPNVLTKEELQQTRHSFHDTLRKFGIDPSNLQSTAQNLRNLTTTGGAGGIVDLFYPDWRLDTATHPKIFSIIAQLWDATYARGTNINDLSPTQLQSCADIDDNDCLHIDVIRRLYAHPHGAFDADSGALYMNRCCFRVSDTISKYHSLGAKKKRTLQRCLAPHLDCCPHNLFGGGTNLSPERMRRWRPIQCFTALTDNLQSNTGGYECVPKFHRQFYRYFCDKSVLSERYDTTDTICVGDFCRMLPKEDKSILDNFRHIEYEAGSVVLFDWRIPHANARQNTANVTREVIYTGFLPNVELNRQYQKAQLETYLKKMAPPDFWGIDNYGRKESNKNKNTSANAYFDVFKKQSNDNYQFSELGKKLMGIQPW